MPTLEEVAKQSREERLGRMARTPDDLATAIRGHSDAALVRRPDATNWAPNEIGRLRLTVAMNLKCRCAAPSRGLPA
jgi:hypothetical protein